MCILDLKILSMNQKFNLQNKVAIITGGAGVLGGSIAKSLSVSGVKIVILDRNQETINNKVAEINNSGGEAIGFETNVLDKATLEQNRDDILNHFGKIDILLNAAGGNMPGATIGPDQTIFDLKIEDFQKVNRP